MINAFLHQITSDIPCPIRSIAASTSKVMTLCFRLIEAVISVENVIIQCSDFVSIAKVFFFSKKLYELVL